MSSWCIHCGSRNHKAFDCTKPHLTYTPTEAELAAEKPAPAPGVIEVKVEPDPTFLPGTFQGCPPICSKTYLPAFDTKQLMNAFLTRNGPSCKVIRSFECEACGKFHMETDAPAPAGGSSGTTRDKGIIPENPYRRRMRASAFEQVQDLPQQKKSEKPPEPKQEEKKKSDGKAKKKLVSGSALGELFNRANR